MSLLIGRQAMDRFADVTMQPFSYVTHLTLLP